MTEINLEQVSLEKANGYAIDTKATQQKKANGIKKYDGQLESHS
jgi:hypothetical protein